MIDAISSSLASNPRSNTVAEQSKRDGATMQMNDFLQLLTAQIANQDPLEPMKDTEFISQMANIASLEQMQQFSKALKHSPTPIKIWLLKLIWVDKSTFRMKVKVLPGLLMPSIRLRTVRLRSG